MLSFYKTTSVAAQQNQLKEKEEENSSSSNFTPIPNLLHLQLTILKQKWVGRRYDALI